MAGQMDNSADAEAREALERADDTVNPGATPDEVQPDEGEHIDSPDPGEPGTQPDEGDVDEPGGVPDEMPAPDATPSPDPLVNLPPD